MIFLTCVIAQKTSFIDELAKCTQLSSPGYAKILFGFYFEVYKAKWV